MKSLNPYPAVQMIRGQQTRFASLRKRLLRTSIALAILPVSAVFSTAWASSEIGSGFHKSNLGNLEIVALSDGTNQLQASFFSKGADATNAPKTYPTAVNTYLVKLADKLILIDTGNGDKGADQPSLMMQNLEAAGYKAEDVSVILLTHFHGDHIGGLLKDGQRRFPNATVYAPKAEAAYWLSAEQMQQAPEGSRGAFANAQKTLAPYQASGQYQEFEAGQVLMDGVTAIAAPGHTPGHTGFLFASGSERDFLMWGDIVHNLSLQLDDPRITIRFDSDKEQAVKTRQAMLERVSQEPLVVAGTHIAFPGMGQVTKQADGRYQWTPQE
mgnify:CR=1 FL=1